MNLYYAFQWKRFSMTIKISYGSCLCILGTKLTGGKGSLQISFNWIWVWQLSVLLKDTLLLL